MFYVPALLLFRGVLIEGSSHTYRIFQVWLIIKKLSNFRFQNIRDVRAYCFTSHRCHLHLRFEDFGPKAYEFADFLHRSHQTVWQILPVSSSSSSQGFSPYGSNNTFAGNYLLISPELLVKDDWLSKTDIEENIVKGNGKTDYSKAQKAKDILLNKGYQNFTSSQ